MSEAGEGFRTGSSEPCTVSAEGEQRLLRIAF